MTVLVVGVLCAVVASAVTAWVMRRAASVPAETPAPAPPPERPSVAVAGPSWADVVGALQLGVVVVDEAGRVQYRNAASQALTGTHIGLLVDEAMQKQLGHARRGRASTETLELYGPPRVAVVVSASPLPDGAAMATVEDVSERRRLDAVRTDFVANVSHELKTPVGALAVLAEALADEDDPEIVQRFLGRMVHESHRVSRTIDDLLELSRIELGEEPVVDLVDVGAVVREAIDRARPLAEAGAIEVAALEVPTDVRVTGDRRQLVSALGNLVENAVKYSEAGASVQVRARAEGPWVELMVADHGIGIPDDEHDRIFERFYRVDPARSRETGGTGLGLAIVRHVATNHGGEVQVSSEEGEGSTFVLRIPRTPVENSADAEPEMHNR
jgi:two-component system sensor histidine kinase SenX3